MHLNQLNHGNKLLFNYKNLNQKLKQIRLLQTLFDLSLEEAKYAVECGELILQDECDKSLVETIRSNSDANYISKRIIDFYQLYNSIFIN